MSITTAEQLLDELKNSTERTINTTLKVLKNLNDSRINWKSNRKKWSVLECLQHLNMTNNHYIKQLNKQLNEVEQKAVEKHKSSFFGKRFASAMKVKPNGKPKFKMGTFKPITPPSNLNRDEVVNTFLKQQEELLQLIEKARKVNINQGKVISFAGKLLTLRVGDALAVAVYHTDRHIHQAMRVRNEVIKIIPDDTYKIESGIQGRFYE